MNIEGIDIKDIEFGEPIEEREPNYRDGYIRGIYRAKNIIDSKQKEIERLNNGLKDIKWYIEKNKTSFSDLYIPASDVVSILVIIDRLLGSDKE